MITKADLTRVTTRIPPHLRRELKAQAALRGVAMEDLWVEALQAYLRPRRERAT